MDMMPKFGLQQYNTMDIQLRDSQSFPCEADEVYTFVSTHEP